MVCWSSWPLASKPLEVWNSFSAFCVCGPILPSAVTFSLVCACLMSSGLCPLCAWLDFDSLFAEAPFDCSLEDAEAPPAADMPLSDFCSAFCSDFWSWLIEEPWLLLCDCLFCSFATAGSANIAAATATAMGVILMVSFPDCFGGELPMDWSKTCACLPLINPEC